MTVDDQADPQRWVDEHGDFLYRFAFARVRNSDVAEDLVQETFLAALQGTPRESEPMAERRWMMGIIKHKIIDHFRRTAREPQQAAEHEDPRLQNDDFLSDGHWKPELSALHSWPDKPDGLLERREFREVLAVCLKRLPPKAAQVFTLREMDEIETDEICRLLGLTQTNLGVILHRARKQLRNCLAARYFGLQREDGIS